MDNTDAHGLMFHHFYDDRHVKGQGAISAQDFAEIIRHYGPENILSAQDWMERALAGTLQPKDTCITFDDALLCQYDIALPVLEDFGLTAFWFVYTSVTCGGLEMLEVHRKFRTVYFDTVDEFYDAFFETIKQSDYADDVLSAMDSYPPDFLAQYSFYTEADKRFRYARNIALGDSRYNDVMLLMIQNKNLDPQAFSADLWMREPHLKELHDKGHIIGLHSHTHPTALASLSDDQQHHEYSQNLELLTQITGERPQTMSHPCGSYTPNTLNILKDLGIRLGFRANMAEFGLSQLEFPREDHTYIMKRLNQYA